MAGVAVTPATRRRDAGRTLQRTGTPKRRRRARTDRPARLPSDPGRHPALPSGHYGDRRPVAEVADAVGRFLFSQRLPRFAVPRARAPDERTANQGLSGRE